METIKKQKVVVFDSVGIFLKMFKRKFREKFEFIEDSFPDQTVKETDRIVYVINNHSELYNFLSKGKRGSAILVCLFINIQFCRSLSSLNLISNLIQFNESKTRTEILQELNHFFSDELNSKLEKKNLKVSQKKNQEYYRDIYFLM